MSSELCGPKVSFENSELRSLPRSANGHDYLLYVRVPASYVDVPQKSYPVVYVLDGYWDFHLLAPLHGLLIFDRLAPEFILVGIGYQGSESSYRSLREVDFKSGRAAFFDVITNEVIPYVDRELRTDPGFRVFAGGSSAADLVLDALFIDHTTFHAYVA